MAVNHITDYPNLINTLKTKEKLVYLCGAGASMALGNHGINWPRWILSGKDYLLPDEQEELERQIGAWSTEELISAATYLLEKLRSNGKYQSFMDNTVGSLHPDNKEFKTALRRMWRAGDLIASTNYDLQIEEAIPAKAVSYSSAGSILPVVLGKAENRIIHLHGMYDKLHGIDDIVADDPQYKGVLADAGAQFIQNLISTHPIIIIGCGGTVEDPNLAGFMSFVVEKLRITDIPYFYIMREGDGIPSLPANAIPVYYGTEYEDLAVFLSELALFRLKKRINLSSIVSVNPYQENGRAVSAFGRLHFSNGFNAFVGRDIEFAKLNMFLETPADRLWWSVTGAGGIGKSRLVLEWLRYIPAQWFGFFIKKTGEIENFTPFTDTVIVFDYILGEERRCAELVEALLEIFDNSPCKLRIIFIERNQQHTDDSWLMTVKHSLTPGARLAFETAGYSAEFLEVAELSEADEKRYVENYLSAYLRLLPADPFTEYCRDHMPEVSERIQKAFRASVDPSCYRPLYLSIFTEVWISKEGELVLNGAEELLNEYLVKEEKRWGMIFEDDMLVQSYMRLLAVACANGRFNITDVMGENYLEDDCERLTNFLDLKSRRPGTRNIFADLFVERDELEETDGETGLFMKLLGIDRKSSGISKEASEDNDTESGLESDIEEIELLSEMSKEERFAFCTPYIKLSADPEEMYLNMLDNKGMLTEKENLRLQRLREKRIQKYASMPDHAWVIEPLFPDIIREYIVAYTVHDWEAVKFAKLARSNSDLEFQQFLTRALEDWSSKEIFEKMTVTPPDEILNYFEYYAGLLASVSQIHDFRPVEKKLYDTDASLFFQRYELELWRRMAVVLTDRGDIERLNESGLDFIRYIENLIKHIEVIDTVDKVLEAYLVGLHNAGDIEKFGGYLEKCCRIAQMLPDDKKIGYLCCENYGRLFHLKLYYDRDKAAEDEWHMISEFLKKYDFPEDMCRMSMAFVKEYLHILVQRNNIGGIRELEEFLELIYKKHPVIEIVEELALTAANDYRMLRRWDKDKRKKEYEKLKQYIMDFPESMRVRSAYISVTEEEYAKYEGSRDVPDKIMTRARAWAEQYPDEIEFQEGYFGLLLTHFEYARRQGRKNEERRTFKRMKELSERTDYSVYREANQMKSTIIMLQKMYGYSN